MAGLRQGGAAGRHCRICQTRAPVRRSRRENRIVTGGDAAAAAAAKQGSRNLLTRVVAALILAPAAIAIAWAGGWLWAGLVTMAAIGLYVEWLMIVGLGLNAGAIATGTAALSLSGFCLASGRIEAALVTVVLGVGSVAAICPG